MSDHWAACPSPCQNPGKIVQRVRISLSRLTIPNWTAGADYCFCRLFVDGGRFERLASRRGRPLDGRQWLLEQVLVRVLAGVTAVMVRLVRGEMAEQFRRAVRGVVGGG